EIRIIKDRTKEPLSQEVLHEHFVNRSLAEVGIERATADLGKTGIGRLKLWILLVTVVDNTEQVVCQSRDTFFKLYNSRLKTFDVWLGMGKKAGEQVLN